MYKRTILASLISIAMLGCSQDATPPAHQTDTGSPPASADISVSDSTAQTSTSSGDLGVTLEHFDTTVRPQDDFFQYVNGSWLKTTQIPKDRSNYSAFTELADKAEADIRTLIEEVASSDDQANTNANLLKNFYLSFMDTDTIESKGLTPIQGELDRINSLTSKDQVMAQMGHFNRLQIAAPVALFVGQDAKESTQYILYLTQQGLGLPDRDYYFKDDERSQTIRDQYIAYIGQVLELAGVKEAQTKARAIFALETTLAQEQWKRVDLRDANKTYNKFELNALIAKTPQLNWPIFLENARIDTVKEVIVRQPSYIEGLDKIINETDIKLWQDYFTFHLLNDAAPYLPEKFVNAHFDFNSKTLAGVEENRPRWKRAINTLNQSVGELIGQLYVEKHFKPEAKERMEQLVENLIASFRQSIDGLEWMSEETKKEAKLKLSKFTSKIGYPNQWKQYEGLTTAKDTLVENILSATAVNYQRNIAKLGSPIDRGEWFMTPQTVNAYYSPVMNEIVFPAAILQPPFFNMEADDAVNYGAIGAVIGHELTHGFDDQGRKFNGEGNLIDWWGERDTEEFKKRADVMVSQYNQFNPIDELTVNGELTLGENIADLGGLTIAYNAYQLSKQGKDGRVIDGFSPEQRFFLGWGQVWRRKYRDEELRRRLVVDSHSPAQYRVQGIVSNMPEFYLAFNVDENDKMYIPPKNRVKIW